MNKKFSQYPLVRKALENVRESYEANGAVFDADWRWMAERSAEILDEYLDCEEAQKESLMAAAVLFQRHDTLHSDAAADVGRDYNETVDALVHEVRSVVDERRGGGASRAVLQVFTAHQIVQFEHLMRGGIENKYTTPDAAESLLADLNSYRTGRDRADYADLGADRLQAYELDVWRKASDAAKAIIRGPGGAPPPDLAN